MSKQLHICIDSNEASGRRDIVNYLRLSGFEVDIRKLDVCDYVVSDRCGIERKDASDFLGSMKDGRLFKQAEGMVAAYEKPIIILEGEMSKALRRSKMKPSSIYGALSSLALDYGLSVIPTQNPKTTGILLHRLAFREQAKEERTIQLRSVNRNMPPHQQQVFLLSGLPQIGTSLAEELLKVFDTPYQIMSELAEAEVKVSKSGKTKRLAGPLKDVKGVGPKIVENAQRLLKGSYSHFCDIDE
jgi:ERCC4-type nuclease